MAKKSGYGQGSIYRRGKIWHIRWYDKDGVRQSESSGSMLKSDAQKLLDERRMNPVPVKDGKVTIGELLDDYREHCSVHRPKSYETFYKPVTNVLRGFWGEMKASSITTQAVKDYEKKRREDKNHSGEQISNATINREISVLRMAFKLAAESTPPKVGNIFPKVHKLPESKPRQGFLEPEQYRALLQSLPEYLRLLLVIAYHSGLRRSIVLEMRRDQVDLVNKKIYLDPQGQRTTKRTPASVPLYGDLLPAVVAQMEMTERDYPDCPLLCHRDGNPMKSIECAWNTACDRAGLSETLFHDLRRTAVRNMKRAGIQEVVAMKISGHKTRAIFDRYNIVDEADIEDAGKKMEVFLDEGGAMEGDIVQAGPKREFACPRCHETVDMLFTPSGKTEGWCQHCLLGVKREEVVA